MGVPTRWESNKFEKKSSYVHFDSNLMFLYILQKFQYKNVHTTPSFFFFHTTGSHSNKAVQLIATHINDTALIMIEKKIKCNVRMVLTM